MVETRAGRTVQLLLVRHGETADNARQIIQGHIDTMLNENGKLQSAVTRDYLKNSEIDLCITSDLGRARQTAEIIMEAHPSGKIIVEPRIKEKYLGKLEGTVYYTAQTKENLATIEKPEKFVGRLLSWFDDLFPSKNGTPSILPDNGKDLNILVVSHGGPIKVIMPAIVKERGVTWSNDAEVRATELGHKIWNCSISEVVMNKQSEQNGLDWTGIITKFASVEHFDQAELAVKQGTEADAAMTSNEQKREQW